MKLRDLHKYQLGVFFFYFYTIHCFSALNLFREDGPKVFLPIA